MTTLDEYININNSYSRSTNLERDTGNRAALNGYILTGRVLEMVERITAALNAGTGGAWSVTGPYGSGKSSLAVFLAALFGDHEADSYATAKELISTVDQRLVSTVTAARRCFDNQPFLDALVTARSEPITNTITQIGRAHV